MTVMKTDDTDPLKVYTVKANGSDGFFDDRFYSTTDNAHEFGDPTGQPRPTMGMEEPTLTDISEYL